MKQQLPTGIQSFQKLREENLLYVDKTRILKDVISSGDYFFLSRPRRFGKSLTLSTAKELFAGNKELFKGLWVEDNWDWNIKYPVIHIHFEAMGYKQKGLTNAISDFVVKEANSHQIELSEKHYNGQFHELLEKLFDKYQQKIVILIDEYDKPILDFLTEKETAKKHRDELKEFYSIIKSSDNYIRFLLITGVSKFSRVSIFSELNNLTDLTIHPEFSTLTGYTQSELEHYFADRIDELKDKLNISKEELLRRIKKWYNGYSWDGINFLYNPFSILSFFGAKTFMNFWFSTGTPTFLVNMLKEKMYFDFDNTVVGQVTLDSFDLENIDTINLLFQTGYLTIKDVQPEFNLYTLAYPNEEVKKSMLQHLIGAFSHESISQSTPIVVRLRKAFLENNMKQVINIINGLFKSIPSHIFINKKEAYYHSVIFLVFQYLGQYIEAEVHTSDGRIDAVVQTDTHIYILEFKLDESAAAAIRQIKEKAYPDKYRTGDKQLVGLGINFSSEKKSVEGWEVVGLE